MNSKSATVRNFQILLVFIHKNFREKPNNKHKNLKPNLDVDKLSP